MIKRTILLTTVFATLLSAAFSVQADNNDYYWTGATNNTYYTGTNWEVNGVPYTETYLDSTSSPSFTKNAYILTTNGTVTIDYSTLGVASLTVGNGIGGEAGTATLNRGGNLDVLTIMTVNKGAGVTVGGAITVSGRNNVPGRLTVNGGTFNANSTTTINAGGELTVNGGTYNPTGMTISGKFSYNSTPNFTNYYTITLNDGGTFNFSGGQFRVEGASAKFDITGGTATISSISYIGVTANGVINQSGGNATFEKALVFGWGNGNGTYNLSGGTLTTESFTGLWCAKSSGFNTFNVTGGTANFGKTGNSFEVGLYNDGTSYTWTPQSVANVFNLNSGTVNAADTFAVQYGGTLNVAKTAENTLGDGVLNANKIEINNGGNLIMSSGTINLGAGGITSSGNGYSITLAGGTLATKGSDWSSALNANVQAGTETTFAPETGKTITWSGNFTKNSDRGTIRKTGAGTLAFNLTSDTSANTIDANLTIDEGTVILNQSPGGGNRFAAGVVVKVNAGGKLLCNAHDSIGYGASAVTFELNGGELAIQSSPNETLINKTVKLKGGTVSTLSNNMMDICANGNAFIVEAETGATAQNPTTSYVKGWLRLRNTTDFNITVNENAKLVVDKNFGIYDNSESTKPLVKLGSGVLVFEGNNSYTQGTKISAGTLILTENGSLGTGAVVNEASLVFAHDSEQTFTNAVSGNGTVTKTGEGRLKINAANGFQASSLIVEAGRLDFKGTLTGGGITLSENTVFSPGNSVGMAAVGGDFTLSSNSSILMEIGGSDTAQNDGLDVSGELKLNEGLIYLQMADTFNLTSGTRFYALLNGSNSGVLSDEDFIEKYVRAYGGFTELEYVQMTEGDYAGKYAITGVFDANAIPEPSTWLLLVLGTAGLLYWRKKK